MVVSIDLLRSHLKFLQMAFWIILASFPLRTTSFRSLCRSLDILMAVFSVDRCSVLRSNPEDVSNFDEEFTKERAVLTPAKERPPLLDADQLNFQNFDYNSPSIL
ncbi:unnamed protein product [Trichobilharzia regenti]|nr:unnamed protein product [Trichobilharzia regenti]